VSGKDHQEVMDDRRRTAK